MSAPAPPHPQEIPFARSYSSAKAFAFCFIPVFLGLAAAVTFHLFVVLPAFGTGSSDLNRMVEVGRLLDKGLSDQPTLVFIGDSVTVEGIDSKLVEQAGPPNLRVLNLGINGCDRAELMVIGPKIAKAKPAAVCIVLRALSIANPPPVSVDGAYAYNLGGFPAEWPEGWISRDTPGVPPDVLKNLNAPTLKAQTHFRTAFQQLINGTLRLKLRKETQAVAPDNFTAPFNMTASISGSTLDKHIKNLDEELKDSLTDGTDRHEAELERLVAILVQNGVRPILITSPTHPRLREPFGPTNARLTQVTQDLQTKYNAIVADASELFNEEGFADGQHLNATGRALLSAFVGNVVKDQLTLTPPAK